MTEAPSSGPETRAADAAPPDGSDPGNPSLGGSPLDGGRVEETGRSFFNTGLNWQSRVVVALVFAVSLGITLSSWTNYCDGRRLTFRNQFERNVDVLHDSITQRLALLQAGDKAGAGFWQNIAMAGRDDWQAYVGSLELSETALGFAKMEFIAPVHAPDIPAFIAAQRLRNRPDFVLSAETPAGGDAYVITDVAPVSEQASVLGLNIALQPTRRKVLEFSRDTGRTGLSEPISLHTQLSTGQDFLLVTPVYRRYFVLNSPEERRASFVGWIATGFHGGVMLHDAVSAAASFGVVVRVSMLPGGGAAGEAPAADALPLYVSDPAADPKAARFSSTRDIIVADRVWRMEAFSSPDVDARVLEGTTNVLGVDLAVAVLVTLGVYLLFVARQQSVLLADQALNRAGRAERRLSSMIDALPAMVYAREAKVGGKLHFFSYPMLRSFGYDPGAIGNDLQWWYNITHPEDFERIRETYMAAIAGDGRFSATYRVRDSSGQWRWVFDSSVVMPGEKDAEPEVVGVISDVTDRHLAAAALAESQNRYAQLSELTFEGVLLHDVKRFYDVNKSLERITGYSRDELMAMRPHHLLAPESWPVVDQGHALDAVTHSHLTAIRKDGTRYPVEVEARAIVIGGKRMRVAAFRDISTRWAAEQAVRDRDRLYRDMVSATSQGYWRLDPETGLTVEVNAALSALLGYPPEGLIGRSPINFADEASRGILENAFSVSTRTDHRVFEATLQHASGRWVICQFSATTTYSPDADLRDAVLPPVPTAIFAFVTDVTADRERLNEIQRLQFRLHRILQSAAEGVCGLDAGGRITFLNAAAERLIGWSEEEALGRVWRELVGRPDGVVDSSADQALNSGQEIEVDGEALLRKDGTTFFAKIGTAPLRDAGPAGDGETATTVVGAVVTFQDVTARLENQRLLAERENLFRQVFDSNTLIRFLLDPITLRFVDINEAGCRFYGYDREFMIGNHLSLITPAYSLETLRYDTERVLTRSTSFLQGRHRLANGDVRETEAYLSPVSFKDQVLIHTIIIDTTERDRLAEALQQKSALLERSNADLQQFAYVASHDLQEPLRMVSSYVQLLQRRYGGALDATGHEFIGFAVDGVRRMSRLILDLLEYSRVETRGGDFEEIDLGAVVQGAIANLSVRIDESRATVVVDGTPPTVRGDESQLLSLFQNLIGNALKYHAADRDPVVRVAWQRRQGMCEVSITDNGIGIGPEYHERIFQIFQRLHGIGEYEGTGIGLALSKRIVERHGGDIWVESEPGVGSVFHFTVPLAAVVVEPV